MVIDSPKGTSRLTLHSAQSLGTGMTSSGEVDIILDRRLMQDDNRGLFQGKHMMNPTIASSLLEIS